MTEPNRNYKDETTFWKREEEIRCGESPLSPRQGSEKKSIWSSWLGSLLIHVFVVFLLFFTVKAHLPVGGIATGRSTAPVGIVFTPDSGGGSDSPDEAEGEETSETNAESEETENFESEPTPSDPEMSVTDRIGMESERIESGKPNVTPLDLSSPASERSSARSKDDGGKGTGRGGRTGRGDGDGQTVGFGELKGKGRRFVYVLDRSESMRWPGDLPIRYALAETKASVESLDPKQGAKKFQIVSYNHDAKIFENGRLMDVTPANKRRALAYLDSVTADGGTDPLIALEKAIRLAPDVIFFLTDADEEIPPMVLARIRELRIRGRVGQIHVMEFGKPTGKRLHSFQKLADQNNGVYIFKDVTTLR